MKIALQTVDGDSVHAGEIPPFVRDVPTVIIWGVRVFTLFAPATSDETASIYRETFSYALP